MTTTAKECDTAGVRILGSVLLCLRWPGMRLGCIILVGHVIAALITQRSNRRSGADRDIENCTPDIS